MRFWNFQVRVKSEAQTTFPSKSTDYLRHRLPNDYLDSFVTAMRDIIRKCKVYKNCDESVLWVHIAFDIQSDEKTNRCLRTREHTLEKCVDICWSIKLVAEHLSRWQQHPSSYLPHKLEGKVCSTLARKFTETRIFADVIIINTRRCAQHEEIITRNVARNAAIHTVRDTEENSTDINEDALIQTLQVNTVLIDALFAKTKV